MAWQGFNDFRDFLNPASGFQVRPIRYHIQTSCTTAREFRHHILPPMHVPDENAEAAAPERTADSLCWTMEDD